MVHAIYEEYVEHPETREIRRIIGDTPTELDRGIEAFLADFVDLPETAHQAVVTNVGHTHDAAAKVSRRRSSLPAGER